jgi:hypothetical protein
MGTRSALTLAAVQQLFQEQTQTMMDEIKSLRDEVASLRAELKTVREATANPANVPNVQTFADVVRNTVAPLVQTSVQSVLATEERKNEVIISKAEEKGDDRKMVDDVCQKMNFEAKPTEMTRLGRAKEGYQRLLKVAFSNPFDARAFRAKFDEQKRSEGIPAWRVRSSRTKEDQATFKRQSTIVYDLNQKAKASKQKESFSLRDDGSIWKFIQMDDGKWKRDSQWLYEAGNGH